jgi:hypothetical protein
MMSHKFARLSVATIVALGAFGASSAVARAQSATACSADSDCTKGFTCQTTGASACPAIACAPNTNCLQPVCDPVVIKTCEPGPCTMDADCATGMVCHADTAVSCPELDVPPACAKDVDCGAPAPAVDAGACRTVATNTCVPKYDLPCKVDADCGDGFTCVPDTSTECSGGGSTGSAGSGAALMGSTSPSSGPTTPVTPAYDGGSYTSTCMTTTLSTSSCHAKSIPCTTDASCPATWTCEGVNSSTIECAGPVEAVDAGGAVDGGVAVDTNCDPGTPTPSPMYCTPPYTDLYDYGNASVPAGSGGDLSATPTAASDTSGDAGAGGASGSAQGAPGTPSVPTATAGCQLAPVGSGAAGGGLSLFGLLGLVGLARRRSR